jgi:flagellar protein FlgJ
MDNISSSAVMKSAWVSSQGKSASMVTKTGQHDTDLQEAATQFEAIFLKMFLDQARKSQLSDDILGSSASDNFQEMFDNEITQLGGKSFNLGLTDVIIRQLQTDREQ